MSCQTSDPKLVRPIIPSLPFHLDVLAHHVKAQRLFHLQIIFQRRIGRRRINVRPAKNPDPAVPFQNKAGCSNKFAARR